MNSIVTHSKANIIFINGIKKITIVVCLIVLLGCLVACDPRRALSETEISELWGIAKETISDDSSWSNKILYLSTDGRLIIHDEYGGDGPDENLQIDLNLFKTVIIQLVSNSALEISNGFFVYNKFNMLSISVGDEDSDLQVITILIYPGDSIVIEPQYENGVDYHTIGVILNLNLEYLYDNEYNTLTEYN